MTVSLTDRAAPCAAQPQPNQADHTGTAWPKPELPAWQMQRELYRSESCSIYQARPRGAPAHCPADYAVKFLHGPLSAQRQEQFRREAWIGGHVKHPHLIPIFSARSEPEASYLVMPLVRGVNIRRVLAQAQRLPICRAVWAARQASEALAELHRAEWFHGDVKPANLMLSREGHVTLIDLGFARRTPTDNGPEGPLLTSVAYAAPELFTTDPADGAADIYSLAITLFEMITGRLPYDGTTAEQLANAHVRHTAADIRDFEPLVPQPIAWLLRRAMAKVPLRRPAIHELRDTLAVAEIELLNQWYQSQ